MKVYAKFRIDIDKEDESIYTQKAVNLMQKLGARQKNCTVPWKDIRLPWTLRRQSTENL